MISDKDACAISGHITYAADSRREKQVGTGITNAISDPTTKRAANKTRDCRVSVKTDDIAVD